MLPSCWEIKKCGREKDGENEKKSGACPAYPDHGHSCWVIAGTFCSGEICGTFAKNETICVDCDVYRLYSIDFGTKKGQFKKEYPQEFGRCAKFFKNPTN